MALSGVFLLCGNNPAHGEPFKILPGHVPGAIKNLKPEGRLAPTNQLYLAIGLPLRNEQEFDVLLQQLYDPASTNYHKYLTRQELAERFGPTEQDYAAVKQFAESHGMTVAGTHPNRLVLDVVGSVENVERAFQIHLHTYRHPAEARDFYAPDSEPSVPAGLPMADITGLSNYSRPRPRWHKMSSNQFTPRNGSSPDGRGAYFGNDFRNAYAPDTSMTGAGQCVGLLEFDGYYASDIAAYAAAAGGGRSNITIQPVLLDNVSGIAGFSGISGADVEVSLDIEMAIAMAPGLAKVVVFEGTNQNDILSSMLSYSNTVQTFSSSWGWQYGPSTTTDNIFKSMAAVGQSFFNASGDSDAFTSGTNSINGVDNVNLDNAPSSCPYITQVGGTTLTNGSGGAYLFETAWNWGYDSKAGGYVGTSGGISSIYMIPYWQTVVSNLPAVGGSTTYRNIPDVALTADNVYVAYGGDGTSEEVGGTSCAAPLWAAFTALVNQQAAAAGNPPVGFINPAIYNLAAGASYTACFHDVTTGSNVWSGSPNLFYAASGYDLCTGLGSPNGQNLINALAGAADSLVVAPFTGFAATGVAGGPFSGGQATFTLTNASASSLNWSIINTSSWINAAPSGGSLTSDQQTTVTTTLTSAASSLAVGSYSANVLFTNQTTGVTHIRPFTLQVTQPLSVSPSTGFSSSGLPGGPFTVTSVNFSLTNLSSAPATWSLVNTSSWLNVSAAGGVLPAEGQTTFTVSLAPAASNLSYGSYSATVLITNQFGGTVSLPFTLQIQTIVQNGGFETGSFSGWTLNGSSRNNSVTSVSSYVHSGSYGAALGQSGSTGYLYQTLNTAPGQTYFLSLWLDNPSNSRGATPNQFLVIWNGATIFNQSNIPFINWTNLQFVVTATSASTILEFGFEDTPAFLGLDDISLTPISPPTIKTEQKTSTTFNLTWSTVTGLVYQAQYTTNLFPANWVNLGQPLTATGPTLTVSDTSPSSQRFYRLVVSP